MHYEYTSIPFPLGEVSGRRVAVRMPGSPTPTSALPATPVSPGEFEAAPRFLGAPFRAKQIRYARRILRIADRGGGAASRGRKAE